jgi:hypothetical protein
MKNRNAILTVILLFSLSASLTMGQVKSDYDKSTDFSQYKTYSFAGWQKASDQQLNDFDKKRILESLRSEFDARGMTYVESGGDAHIALFLQLDDKKSTTAYTNYMGGMGYGARWGWGMGAGMGSATTTYSEKDYVEGTLVVDMYDASEKKLLWQGVMTKVVNDNPQKREKTIPKNISKLMKKFPLKPEK